MFVSLKRGLVRGIREKSAVSCSFDRFCELALMIGASAGDAAGKDFRTLRHALSELRSVLIINSLGSVNAEHTNLFAGLSYRSFRRSLHDNSPFKILRIKTARRRSTKYPQNHSFRQSKSVYCRARNMPASRGRHFLNNHFFDSRFSPDSRLDSPNRSAWARR